MRPREARCRRKAVRDFNPRIPYGMRRSSSLIITARREFQSTHPVWDATLLPVPTVQELEFQSTHPVWDATGVGGFEHFIPAISIHASRMGCDPPTFPTSYISCDFNPRIPYGMRHVRILFGAYHAHFNPRIPYGMRPETNKLTAQNLIFQSTHPVWDATFQAQPLYADHPISIHASRMGCDLKMLTIVEPSPEFQSTHPVWDATFDDRSLVTLLRFQSTHPVWDATSIAARTRDARLISIHASRMGCDHTLRQVVQIIVISIHASRMGCDIGNSRKPLEIKISIHASRMGCDDTRRQDGRPQVNFNPRIPYGMRLFVGVAVICTCVFQSTHPVWDATRKKTADALTIYFNPRIPYGMRLPSADLIIRES